MTNRKRRAAVALAGLLLLGSAWWFVLRAPSPAAPAVAGPAVATSDAVEPAPVAAAATGASQGVPTAPAPLPPLGAPLADTLPELQRQATAGVPAAACRLAAEWQFCAGLPRHREEHASWLASRRMAPDLAVDPNRAGDAATFTRGFESELAVREPRLAAHERHCAGLTTPAPERLLRLWRDAARLGAPVAVRHYASGAAFRWEGVLDSLDVLQAYRNEAADMARALAREGDLPMLLQLAGATAPLAGRESILLGQVLEADAAYSLALYQRALSALEGVDSHKARSLATDIRSRMEMVSQFSTPEQQAEAARIGREFDAWRPVRTRDFPPRTSVHGMSVRPTAAACQGVFGPPEGSGRPG